MTDRAVSDTVAHHHETMRTGLREAMSSLPGGIVVVTTWIAGRPWGTTVSSCCSLSMHPPLLLVCLENGVTSTRTILEQGCFGVNLLGNDQEEVALRTSKRGEPKFLDDLVVAESVMGTPSIRAALASIHCELYNAVEVGDHTIVIGQVDDVELGPTRPPLLYFNRRFWTLVETPNTSVDGR
jgi:flavin reductase ActVB